MKRELKSKSEEEMLAEYDFRKGVRGKYYGRVNGGSRVLPASHGKSPAPALRRAKKPARVTTAPARKLRRTK